jgi:MFS family permease
MSTAPAGRSWPVAWRWVHVGIAALTMVLTLPGRTQGLGLFTEPLLKSLALDRESYGFLNMGATLLGALFCLPCGRLLDRLGTKVVLVSVTGILGATVLAMSRWTTGAWHFDLPVPLPDWLGGSWTLVVMVDLFLFLLFTRGLGQSALSVVSLAMIGKAAGRRSGWAMGVYACVVMLGFLSAFQVLTEYRKVHPDEWRAPWAGIGLAVLCLGVGGSAFVRNHYLDDVPGQSAVGDEIETSSRPRQALGSPVFWTFSVAISFYGMVAAGTSLYNQNILEERGFSKEVYFNVLKLGVPVGLAANLFTGWLSARWPLNRLMALATVLLAAALATFPFIETETQVYVYAAALAIAGGAMTVCFYAVYRQAFGPAHLGSIQGAAQLLTVLFSAAGPTVFASTQARLGSYVPVFQTCAAAAFGLAIAIWVVQMPTRRLIMDTAATLGESHDDVDSPGLSAH